MSNEEYARFPVDSLPASIKQIIVEGADSLSCDESYLALPAISLSAGIIGTSYRVQVNSTWATFPIIWAVFIGESGTAKTPALKLMRGPLDKYENEAHRKRLAEQAARRRMKKDRDRQPTSSSAELQVATGRRTKRKANDHSIGTANRIVSGDTTIEALVGILDRNPSGLVVIRDELSGWMRGMDKYAAGKNTGELAHWLSMYSGLSITLDRKTGKPKHVHIPTAAVSICGGIQPEVLCSCFTGQHFDSGFVSRFLMASPPRKQRLWPKGGVSSSVLDQYHRTIGRLIGLRNQAENTTTRVRLDDEALELFQQFYIEHNAEAFHLQGPLASAWSKLEEIPVRIALILNLLNWAESQDSRPPSTTINGNTMRNAIRITNWFKCEAKRIYGELFNKKQIDLAGQVIEFIEAEGGRCSVRRLQQGMAQCKRLRSDGIRQILGELVKAGHGEWGSTNLDGRGREGEVFVLRVKDDPLPCSILPPCNQSVPQDSLESLFDESEAHFGNCEAGPQF